MNDKLLGGRDWNKQPPESMEDAFQLAEALANEALEQAMPIVGMRGWTERREKSVVVVWEDGEITNELELDWVQ